MIIFVERFKSKDSDELLCIHFENQRRNSLTANNLIQTIKQLNN